MQTVLPSCPLPNIYWLGRYLQAEHCVIDIGENYIKQSYRNRFDISGHLGRLNLSFPIQKESGVKLPFTEVRLHDEMHWKKLHWRSIVSAYNSSPFFEHYAEELSQYFCSEDVFLCELNSRLLEWLLNRLRIVSNHTVSLEYLDPGGHLNDHRNDFKGRKWVELEMPSYLQVFHEKIGFIPNLSGIDLLFNLGPDAHQYLSKLPLLKP